MVLSCNKIQATFIISILNLFIVKKIKHEISQRHNSPED